MQRGQPGEIDEVADRFASQVVIDGGFVFLVVGLDSADVFGEKFQRVANDDLVSF